MTSDAPAVSNALPDVSFQAIRPSGVGSSVPNAEPHLPALYDEIGFARSLLACELQDGRLKRMDGRLRQELTPEEEVAFLDVNAEEARKLLQFIGMPFRTC